MGKAWTGAIFVGLSSLAFAQVDQTMTVVTINGEAVKGAEYYRRMEFLPGVGRRVGDSLMESPPGFITVVQLIFERLVLQTARDKGVLPSKAEIDAELKNRIEDDPKLLERWSSKGRSQAELDELVRFELAQFKLQTFGVNITDQEVDKFYKENPASFTSPKAVRIRVIAVDPTQTGTVDSELQAGKKFEDVAKAHSKDVTRGVGGLIGTVPVNYLPQTARSAVNAIKIGENTSWLDVGATKVKYNLLDVVPEKLQPMSPLLKRATRRKLMLDRGRVKNNLLQEIEAARAKAKIQITNKEFAEMYQRMTTPIAGS